MVTLFLTFWRTAHLFSQVVTPFYVPTMRIWELQSSHTLVNTCYCPCFYQSHPHGCEVVSLWLRWLMMLNSFVGAYWHFFLSSSPFGKLLPLFPPIILRFCFDSLSTSASSLPLNCSLKYVPLFSTHTIYSQESLSLSTISTSFPLWSLFHPIYLVKNISQIFSEYLRG